MTVSTLSRFSAGAALIAMLAAPAVSRAGAPTSCDKIAQDVRESVEKDPSKVLMIVEDALVINETCACEIVRAAITAAKADAPLVKQIVQTSIAVAPKMTAVIEECSGSDVSGAAVASNTSQDSGKNVVDVSGKSGGGKNGMDIQPPKDGTGADGANGSSRGSGNFGSNGIRGPYLIQPATGVFGSGGTTPSTNKDRDGRKDSKPDERGRNRPRVIIIRPVSPTSSDPKLDEPK
jgi:hypothetical protein